MQNSKKKWLLIPALLINLSLIFGQVPMTKLIDQQCDGDITVIYPKHCNTPATARFHFDLVPGAESYQMLISTVIGNYPFIRVVTSSGSQNFINFFDIPGIEDHGIGFNRQYNVKVRAKVNGQWGILGPLCTITQRVILWEKPCPFNNWRSSDARGQIHNPELSLNIYPNPTKQDGFNIELRHFNEENNNISIEVYDLLGKDVYSKTIIHDQNDFQSRITPNTPLLPGIYMVNVSVNDKTFSKKLLVR